jgi:formylglycine-generating enzyme required for sulfatase activity
MKAIDGIAVLSISFRSKKMATKKLVNLLETKVNEVDGMNLVLIPAGTFKMGADADDFTAANNEKPPVDVTLTKSYWMATTAVTQEMFEKVMVGIPNRSAVRNAENPVTGVTFSEAAAYCKKVGGRLPSEAEYEWAARSGKSNSRPANLKKECWFRKNSDGVPHPVAQLKPNEWGLYDMIGNVVEVTCTPWDFALKGGVDPGVGNDDSAIERATRSGGYANAENMMTASSRSGFFEQEKPKAHPSDFPGFRYIIPA